MGSRQKGLVDRLAEDIIEFGHPGPPWMTVQEMVDDLKARGKEVSDSLVRSAIAHYKKAGEVEVMTRRLPGTRTPVQLFKLKQ